MPEINKSLNPDQKAQQTVEALTPQPFENWQATKEIQEIANQISGIVNDPTLTENEKNSKIYELIKETPDE